MHTVVFYSGSDAFGGHEKMALAAQTAMQRYKGVQIRWLVDESNLLLIAALEKEGIEYSTLANPSSSSTVRSRVGVVWRIVHAALKLQRLSPDLVVVVQGNIVLSYGGVLSSIMARRRYCSYVPMSFRVSDITKHKARIGAQFIVPLLYKTISSYITIDPEQARRLQRENSRACIMVVENYVPKPELTHTHHNAMADLKIPEGRKVLALIGRIKFAHKSQDWVVKVLKDDVFLKDKFVLFVGDGPDSQALQEILAPGLRDRFGLIGWKGDLRDVYAATDVLLIPSTNEGVPLVMLEALSCQIPVVGSDQDGMRSWLPADWRFSWGDTEGFKRAIEQAIRGVSPDVWAKLGKRLERVHDEERFASEFSAALTKFCLH